MDPIFKELTKLESLSVPSSSSSSSHKKSKTSSSSSSSPPALSVTLDGLIASLVKAQAKAASPSVSQEELKSIWAALEKEIGGSREKIDEVSRARSGRVDPRGLRAGGGRVRDLELTFSFLYLIRLSRRGTRR